jgi:VWFA-related protein
MVTTYSVGGLKILLTFSDLSEEWSRALASTLNAPGRTSLRDVEHQQILTDIGEVLKEVSVDRSTASSLLQGVLARAQHYATAIDHDSRMLIEALQNLAGALAAVSGPKSMLYLGDGFAMRPGHEVFELLSTVFEDDRRFGDRSVVAGGSEGDGSASDGAQSGGDGASRGGAVVSLPPRTASPVLRGGITGFDLTREVEGLTAAANGQRVTFYAISSASTTGLGSSADLGRGARIAANRTSNDSPSGLANFESSRLSGLQETLDYTAEATGGLASAAGADVSGFLDRMWSQSRSYYSLAYPVPNPDDGGLRRIKVKVKRKGLRVTHPSSYLAKPRSARIGDLMTGALLLRTGDNPHRLETGLASQQASAGGAFSVAIGLKVPPGALELIPVGDDYRADLQVYVLTMDQRGRLSKLQFAEVPYTVRASELEAARARPFVATFPLVLERGSFEVVVALAETSAQRLSVARATIEVGKTD